MLKKPQGGHIEMNIDFSTPKTLLFCQLGTDGNDFSDVYRVRPMPDLQDCKAALEGMGSLPAYMGCLGRIVYARKFWHRTSIHLESSANYHFKATGKWTDLIIETDADGFQRRYLQPFEAFRRVPTQNWFALIGTVDRMMITAFLIGKEVILTPPKSGELVCFANDVAGFYWNSWGRLKLTITRMNGLSLHSI